MQETYAQMVRRIVESSLTPLYSNAEQAEAVAWWILCAITDKTKLELLFSQRELSKEQNLKLKQWLYEHGVKNKPLAYLIGSVPFLDSTILVEPPLLIPRLETEEWVLNLIKKLQKLPNKKISILDLCTGTGAIACALAKALPEATIVATDISEHAVIVTQKNAEVNGATITCIKSDLFSALDGMRFDIIVSNPPYISHAEWQKLDSMVKDWEDYHALVASDNGLGLISAICQQAGAYLIKNSQLSVGGIAQLYCEIGYNQGQTALELMRNYFLHAVLICDYNGKDRVIAGSLS